MRVLLLGLLLIAAAAANPAQAAARLVQCEHCVTLAQATNSAVAAGFSGKVYVFSFKNNLFEKFDVEYDWELRRYLAFRTVAEPAAAAGFFSLKEAHDYDPTGFYAKDAYITPIGTVNATANYNPVTLSIQGTHQPSFGYFRNDVRVCMSSASCVSRISPQLFSLTQADYNFTGVGVSILGFGGNVSWERLPASVTSNLEVRFCDANRDCAKFTYGATGWEYQGTFAEDGRGGQYPLYPNGLTYSAETGVRHVEHGLAGAGVTIGGYLRMNYVLRCSYVDERLQRCDWMPR